MQNCDLLRNLILMARADGVIDEAESSLLDSRREKWGVSNAEFAKLLAEDPNDLQLYIPESPSLRHDLLVDMALMMAADGRIEDLELQLLKNAAQRMGVHEDQLTEILDEYTDHDDDLVLGED